MVKLELMIRKRTLEGFYILIGCMFMGMGTALFLLPNQLSSGGFSGIATIVYYLLDIPLGITILVLNIPLFILALFKIGREILVKSMAGTLLLSTFIDLFENVQSLTTDRLLASIYGGISIGLGLGLVLKAGGSTGGTDLLSYITRTYKNNIKVSDIIVIVDIVIVGLNVIFFGEIEIGLYSAIAIYIVGKMIDLIFEGVNFAKMIFIVSNKYKEIAKQIGDELGRGSTGVYAKGMYTREKKMMLLCVVSRNEVEKIKQIARKIDRKSFIIISNAREVLGKGFK